MQRREFIGTALASSVALFGIGRAEAAGGALQPLPKRRRIRVAFMIGDDTNVIDTAGPWEVFQDVMIHGDEHYYPFELYTVAPTRRPAAA